MPVPSSPVSVSPSPATREGQRPPFPGRDAGLALLLPRENGLLVLRFRMNWTVGGKGTLSPALAERIMEALENNAFASSWTLLRAVPPHSLSVAGGHRGGHWPGISGSSREGIRSDSFRQLGLVRCTLGGGSGCTLGSAHPGGIRVCATWRSRGRALEAFQSPDFQLGDSVAREHLVVTVGRGMLVVCSGLRLTSGVSDARDSSPSQE